MKCGAAYKRAGQWLFSSASKTVAGVWIASPPFLSTSGSSAEIGTCAIEVLNASVEGTPHPTKWDGLFSPVLELAGVKTWRAFVKGTLLVGIEMEEDGITFTPHRNDGPKEGFLPLRDKEIALPAAASPAEIGEAIQRVVLACT
jgi:hypothetical protein